MLTEADRYANDLLFTSNALERVRAQRDDLLDDLDEAEDVIEAWRAIAFDLQREINRLRRDLHHR